MDKVLILPLLEIIEIHSVLKIEIITPSENDDLGLLKNSEKLNQKV